MFAQRRRLAIAIAVTVIAVFALWRWANGQPVDLMGFAALVGAAATAADTLATTPAGVATRG